MFDPRSEAREFFAESAAAAIAEACSFFGCSEADLTTGSPREAAGLGERALIVAVPSAARRRPGERAEHGRAPRGYERGAPRERRGRSESRERPRGGRRERDDRGGRRRPHHGDERGEAPRETAAPAEPSLGAPQGELGPIGEFVRGALERMDLGPFQIGQRAEQGLDVILLEGPAARALAAGGGRAVEALQLLANQAARVQSEQAGPGAPDGPPRRVVLDVEGDREKRQDYHQRPARRRQRWQCAVQPPHAQQHCGKIQQIEAEARGGLGQWSQRHQQHRQGGWVNEVIVLVHIQRSTLQPTQCAREIRFEIRIVKEQPRQIEDKPERGAEPQHQAQPAREKIHRATFQV